MAAYWFYRAYDEDMKISAGVVVAPTFLKAILEIRQGKLLQVYDIQRITEAKYKEYLMGEKMIVKLNNMQARMEKRMNAMAKEKPKFELPPSKVRHNSYRAMLTMFLMFLGIAGAMLVVLQYLQ